MYGNKKFCLGNIYFFSGIYYCFCFSADHEIKNAYRNACAKIKCFTNVHICSCCYSSNVAHRPISSQSKTKLYKTIHLLCG